MRKIRQTLFVLVALFVGFVFAQDEAQPQGLSSDYRGLVLATPFPATTASLGETTTLDLTVRNYGLPPQLLNLEATRVPEGWTATFLGNGVPVKAVQVGTDESAELSLRLEPPADVKAGDYAFELQASGDNTTAALPITLTLTQLLPPKLTLETDLPSLKGSPTTNFSFNVTLKNESGTDTTVNLQAQSQPGFIVTFSSGGNEVTSVPVKAGGSQRLSVKVQPFRDIPAGDYQVLVQAVSDQAQAELPLALSVSGQPSLNLTSVNGVLSARADLGRETSLDLVVVNDGTAPAQAIKLSATKPSGWEVSFEPEEIPALAPGEQQTVKVTLTPAKDAIAGDYVVTMRANADGLSDSAEFRITTTASTVWGAVGVGVIAVALLVMGGAVTRFGRR
jgi:uncharacterized membrane protein